MWAFGFKVKRFSARLKILVVSDYLIAFITLLARRNSDGTTCVAGVGWAGQPR
jgi:hypothetical protein